MADQEAKYRFRDLIEVDELQRLMECFHAATGIPVGIIGPDNDILVAVGWQRLCVDFHRAHPVTCALCHASDGAIFAAIRRGEIARIRCGNGLWDIGIPLMVDGTFYATLFVGQFLYDDDQPDLEEFRARARRLGFDEEAYMAALAMVPRYDRDHMARIEAYYSQFARFIADLAAKKAAILLTNRDLEAGVERRTAELHRSNQELEQFAYAVSHDLQEPLRMVSSYVQLIRRRLEGRLEPDIDEFIGFAVDGAKRMSGMIDALLEYSRVHTQAGDVAVIDADAALDQALGNLRLAIDLAGARIETGPLPRVTADFGQLVRLFQNLVGNAIKYHADGRTPAVTVLAERQGAMCLFRVADDGIGIAPEDRDRVFGIFQRLNTRQRFEGSGVGLAVCKRIVERHGGEIAVEDNPGGGAVLRFTLPAG